MSVAWSQHGPADAHTVVLLPSLGSDRSMWQPQVDALRATRHLVVVEPRGHGAAPAPAGDYSIEDLAGDVLAVTDALRVDTFDLVGISMGGLTALWIAAHMPEQVRTLTVANTAAHIGTHAGWQDRMQAVRRHGMAGICEPVLARFFTDDFRRRRPDVITTAREALLAVRPEGYVGCCAALAAADLTAVVGGIVAPTLVIAGQCDEATGPAEVEALHRAVPRSTMHTLPGAGHLSNLERPAGFTGLLRAHLRLRGDGGEAVVADPPGPRHDLE